METGNQHCFAFLRENQEGSKLLVLSNFSEHTQQVNGEVLNAIAHMPCVDLITDTTYSGNEPLLTLRPYQQLWLAVQ